MSWRTLFSNLEKTANQKKYNVALEKVKRRATKMTVAMERYLYKAVLLK